MYLRQRQTVGVTRWRLMVSLLCIALVVFAGTLSVAHAHDRCDASHADCGLCATAHATVQVSVALTPAPIAKVLTRVEARVPAARPRTLFHYSLFTRPPPVDRPLSA